MPAMKAARLLLLLPLLLAGCAYHDTFALRPGETFVIPNTRVRELNWTADYPVTVTEGRCKAELLSSGSIECSNPAAITIHDSRPTLLYFARTNYVRVSYPVFSKP